MIRRILLVACAFMVLGLACGKEPVSNVTITPPAAPQSIATASEAPVTPAPAAPAVTAPTAVDPAPPAPASTVPAAAAPIARTIKMATTTSTENSGLLTVLLPAFTAKTGIEIQVIAVGTGKAIKHGENGDVDVLLVHDPEAEEKFVAQGFGVARVSVMYNDFVIVGPAADPAGLAGGKDAAAALAKIAAAKVPFVSRGDASGTHVKEQNLWQAAGVAPAEEWYISAGQGMGQVLIMADEKQGYTLTDRATFVAYAEKVKLAVLCEGDERLFNPYAVIAVNPAKHAHVKQAEARAFVDYLVSPEGQAVIAGFKVKGQQVFIPSAK
ncbi:MAG: substrate-binding domain-containing protein [Planctomycetota bacterium]